MRDGVERIVWSRWLADGEALPFRGGYLGNCDLVQRSKRRQVMVAYIAVGRDLASVHPAR
jgi:hypothetical protein